MNNLEPMIQSWFAKKPAHGLTDIAGNKESVRRLQEIVKIHSLEFQKFEELSQFGPKSSTYLFYGEPGTGVSYMAKAFAHELLELGYVYMDVKGSQFHSKYVGEGERNIALLFEEATKHAPCVLLIDGIEAICEKRSNPHMAQYLFWLTNAFLEAYNHARQSKVIVIGVTNHPLKVDDYLIDHASLIRVDAPDLETLGSFKPVSSAETKAEIEEFEKLAR